MSHGTLINQSRDTYESYVKVPMATVAEAVSVMDYSRLRLEDVCALLQYLPLPDEEVLLRKYVGGEGGGLSSSPTKCRGMSPW